MASNPSDNRKVEWVSLEIIRQIFNQRGIFELVKQGKIKTKLKRDSHPLPPPVGEPVCTYSQIVYYYDQEDKPLAIVHQYLRPDGSVGASGLPDPKRVFLEDRIVSIRTVIKK
jgi:hypothetical protein